MSAQNPLEIIHNSLLRRMQGKKHIKSSGLLQALSLETGLSVADVKHYLGKLQRDGRISGSVNGKGDLFGQIIVIGELPKRELSTTEQAWKQALIEEGLFEDTESLMNCASVVQGLSSDDLKSLLNGIKELKKTAKSTSTQDPYVASARYLLGSAKALQRLGTAFSVPFSQFAGRAAYVVAAGPKEPECILFIENQASFEMFCTSEVVSSAMGVMTFGYGLSWSGIADSIGRRNIVQLIRTGTPPELTEVIQQTPCYFWGDLDREGLNIFLQLKAKIPQLRLSALYLPMIDMVKDMSRSHPYCQLAEKVNQRLLTSEDALVSKLAELCSNRAVDQEALDISEFLSLYRKELSEDLSADQSH